MFRAVRKVHKDWVHPRGEDGEFILLWWDYRDAVKIFELGKKRWSEGSRWFFEPDGSYNGVERDLSDPRQQGAYEEWYGQVPRPENCLPDWPDEERTHFQLYEFDIRGGTPISPVVASMEAPEMDVERRRRQLEGGDEDARKYIRRLIRKLEELVYSEGTAYSSCQRDDAWHHLIRVNQFLPETWVHLFAAARALGHKLEHRVR
jgi:hypothetical protein